MNELNELKTKIVNIIFHNGSLEESVRERNGDCLFEYAAPRIYRAERVIENLHIHMRSSPMDWKIGNSRRLMIGIEASLFI